MMQDYALTLDKFLDHAARWHSDTEVVSANAGATVVRANYQQLRQRSNLLSGALSALNLVPGDRLATLAWNTQHHFQIWYACVGAGYVCHTLNPRLRLAQLAAMVNEAGDRVLAFGTGLAAAATQLLECCPCIEHLIALDHEDDVDSGAESVGAIRAWTFDSLLREHGRAVAWGGFDEHAAAGLCYTSGTTGAPKGVLYTHRSNYLHTLRLLQADAVGLTANDSVLMAVPMFHANGWGLPFAAPAVGAKLVLPGRALDGCSVARVMYDEAVTLAAGVPTVWLGLLDYLDRAGIQLPALRRVIVGGSQCPQMLIERLESRLGITVQTSWGMTELSPLGTICAPNGPRGRKASAGRTAVGLDLKLTDAAGERLPQQRGVMGHLKVKGASVADRYFGSTEPATDHEGYFDTGDLAIIDPSGELIIAGRSKDLIKSGGEWINPTEIEDIIGTLEAVALAAVIGRPDAKWGERPILVIEPRQGYAIDDDVLLGSLRGRVENWWIPDAVLRVTSMPLAVTGKIDKVRLRADLVGT